MSINWDSETERFNADKLIDALCEELIASVEPIYRNAKRKVEIEIGAGMCFAPDFREECWGIADYRVRHMIIKKLKEIDNLKQRG